MEYVHKCSMAIYGCKETKPNQREILAALVQCTGLVDPQIL